MLQAAFALGVCSAALAPTELLSVAVKDSLEASLTRVQPELGSALSAQSARLLRWRGDINRAVRRGDRLKLLFRPSETEAEPDLLALVFAGEALNLRAYRFAGSDGVPRYYDEHGALIEPVMLNAPVPNYVQITETVQHGRGRRRHRGIDLKAPEGAAVRLPFAGTVVRTNWAQRVNGRCIEVRLDNGRLAHFLHLSRIDSGVRAGAHLAAGTPLGAVGSTGHSNGPHLHYEILADGRPLEPLDVHGRRPGRLDAAHMTDFLAQRDANDRALIGPAVVAPRAFSAADCLPLSTDAQKPLGCKP